MPTWLKVMLVVAGVMLLLLVLAVVAGVYVVRRYGPPLVEATKRNIEEGEEYGRRTDNEGCLNEAVARQARVEGLRDMLKNNLFTRACLEASRPTPGFCDDVPRQDEFMRGITWQTQQCKRHGLPPEKQCGQLFQQVQQFCESRRASPAANANAGGGGSSPPAPQQPPRAR